jgi:glycerol-3-phosphate O-acyltransferase/dihydroxyacetone phosphate acyltransferase
MWLLPHLPRLSGAAVRLYFRASRSAAGDPVPSTGPVLLVSNHPNSLLDPAFVAWVANRPVRFLAKAPLFSNLAVGWLVRGAGSIPVYRRADDPGQMRRNEDAFRAVYAALQGGAAVALFPEGISHSEPALVPLKTGAARIALGAAPIVGRPFPIVPVGLVFRAKDRFRSEAHAEIGTPVVWDDLGARPADDHEAVRELTARIDRAMRQVTLNLERWEDEPIVRTAEGVWAAVQRADPSPAARVKRLAVTADALAALRSSDADGDGRWRALARDVREHARILRVLGVRATDVELETNLSAAARWVFRRLTLIGIAQGALAVAATLVFWLPYRFTGYLAGRLTPHRDTVATYRVLGGAAVFLAWIGMLVALAVFWRGWRAGAAAGLVLPVLAVAGLVAAERARETLVTARRWLLVRAGDPRIAVLRERQRALAQRLDEALTTHLQRRRSQ